MIRRRTFFETAANDHALHFQGLSRGGMCRHYRPLVEWLCLSTWFSSLKTHSSAEVSLSVFLLWSTTSYILLNYRSFILYRTLVRASPPLF